MLRDIQWNELERHTWAQLSSAHCIFKDGRPLHTPGEGHQKYSLQQTYHDKYKYQIKRESSPNIAKMYYIVPWWTILLFPLQNNSINVPRFYLHLLHLFFVLGTFTVCLLYISPTIFWDITLAFTYSFQRHWISFQLLMYDTDNRYRYFYYTSVCVHICIFAWVPLLVPLSSQNENVIELKYIALARGEFMFSCHPANIGLSSKTKTIQRGLAKSALYFNYDWTVIISLLRELDSEGCMKLKTPIGFQCINPRHVTLEKRHQISGNFDTREGFYSLGIYFLFYFLQGAGAGCEVKKIHLGGGELIYYTYFFTSFTVI